MNIRRRSDRHESIRSIDARHVHWAAIGFFGGFALVAALSWLLWRVSFPVPDEGIQAVPPSPRLQAHPGPDLHAERARETNQLTGYAWVDRRAGIARIPITRAVQILIDQHAAARLAPTKPAGGAR